MMVWLSSAMFKMVILSSLWIVMVGLHIAETVIESSIRMADILLNGRYVTHIIGYHEVHIYLV